MMAGALVLAEGNHSSRLEKITADFKISFSETPHPNGCRPHVLWIDEPSSEKSTHAGFVTGQMSGASPAAVYNSLLPKLGRAMLSCAGGSSLGKKDNLNGLARLFSSLRTGFGRSMEVVMAPAVYEVAKSKGSRTVNLFFMMFIPSDSPFGFVVKADNGPAVHVNPETGRGGQIITEASKSMGIVSYDDRVNERLLGWCAGYLNEVIRNNPKLTGQIKARLLVGRYNVPAGARQLAVAPLLVYDPAPLGAAAKNLLHSFLTLTFPGASSREIRDSCLAIGQKIKNNQTVARNFSSHIIVNDLNNLVYRDLTEQLAQVLGTTVSDIGKNLEAHSNLTAIGEAPADPRGRVALDSSLAIGLQTIGKPIGNESADFGQCVAQRSGLIGSGQPVTVSPLNSDNATQGLVPTATAPAVAIPNITPLLPARIPIMIQPRSNGWSNPLNRQMNSRSPGHGPYSKF